MSCPFFQSIWDVCDWLARSTQTPHWAHWYWCIVDGFCLFKQYHAAERQQCAWAISSCAATVQSQCSRCQRHTGQLWTLKVRRGEKGKCKCCHLCGRKMNQKEPGIVLIWIICSCCLSIWRWCSFRNPWGCWRACSFVCPFGDGFDFAVGLWLVHDSLRAIRTRVGRRLLCLHYT